MRSLALLLLLAMAPAAWSAEPVTTVADDGTITCTLTVDAPASQVRAHLQQVDGIPSPDVYSVAVTERRGRCEAVRRQTRGIWRPFSLFSLRCPTERGWKEELLQSDDFLAYQTEWRLDAQGESSTRITYTIRTELSASVPSSLVRKGTIAGARDAVVALALRALGADPN